MVEAHEHGAARVRVRGEDQECVATKGADDLRPFQLVRLVPGARDAALVPSLRAEIDPSRAARRGNRRLRAGARADPGRPRESMNMERSCCSCCPRPTSTARTAEELVAPADRALYEAKRSGKNTVAVADLAAQETPSIERPPDEKLSQACASFTYRIQPLSDGNVPSREGLPAPWTRRQMRQQAFRSQPRSEDACPAIRVVSSRRLATSARRSRSSHR